MSVDSSRHTPIAQWNPAGAWEKPGIASLFCEHSELYSETFRTSGMMRSGRLFPLPQPERRTAVSESSSSPTLPTPTASLDAGAPAPWKPDVPWWLQSRAARNLEGVVTGNTPLLPTPSAGNFNDGEDPASWEARREVNLAKGINGNGQGTPLTMAVQMLPTPQAIDGHPKRSVNPASAQRRLDNGKQAGLPEVIMTELLPTPSAGDGTGGHSSRSGSRRSERLLGGLAKDLLPTPTEDDAKGSRNSTVPRKPGSTAAIGDTLTDAVDILSGKRERALLPTPRSGHGMNDDLDSAKTRLETGARSRSTLEEATAMMPTPNSRDWKGSPSKAWSGQASLPRTTAQLSAGDSTSPASAAGSSSSDEQLPGQLSLDQVEE